jgi:uncharacterized membrane protein HdeD (DUF308 family)
MASKSLPAKSTLMVMGIVLTPLGVLLLVAPAAVGGAVVRLAALVLAVTGVAHALGSLRAASVVNKTISLLLGGIVAGVGILIWFNPELGSGFLTALLMIFFAVNGLWKLSTSLRFRPLANWWWLLLSGLLSLVLAGMLWNQWPISGAWAIGVFVGIDLVATGIPMIVLARAMRKSGKSDYLDTINL